MLPDADFSINITDIFALKDILILAMQAIVATENPVPDFVFWLEGISSLGGVKNSELYHFRVLKLNIAV